MAMIIFIILFVLLLECTAVFPPYMPVQGDIQNRDDLYDLVATYFQAGYTISVICAFLYYHHGIKRSVRQLKRICRTLGLRRRGCPESPEADIIQAITEELMETGSCCGYRSMWQRLVRDHHLHVKRETVRQMLSTLDPVGVASRKRRRLRRRMYVNKGPHYLVHIDGYDKLKPFGFAIHGAIDGFSRRVLWLEVGPSNNDPNVVAQYFIDYIRQVNGVPHIIRADRGSENTVIEKIQVALRYNDNDGYSAHNSFLYGKSTRNQRIERWWGSLRAGGMNFWINFFKDMCDTGALDPSSTLEKECLRYCFMMLLRADLYRISRLWNEHLIRCTKNSECESGKPDEMFFLPELYGTKDFKHDIDSADLDAIEEVYCVRTGEHGCSNEFEAAVQMIMQEQNLEMPTTCYDALVLYGTLMDRLL